MLCLYFSLEKSFICFAFFVWVMVWFWGNFLFMKRFFFKFFFTLLSLHASVDFSFAATVWSDGYFDSFLSETDSSSALNVQQNSSDTYFSPTVRVSVPHKRVTHVAVYGQNALLSEENLKNPWYLFHQMIANQGFTWTGSIAAFLWNNGTYTPSTPVVDTEAASYNECIVKEVSYNFRGAQTRNISVFDTLRGIAKHCAQEFYGPYFDGKKYTTREEMIMALFALFEEWVSLPGEFDDSGNFHPDGFSFAFSGYKNVSPTSWYAPYLKRAKSLGMLGEENSWQTAKEVTDDEISTYLEMYGVYRMEYTWTDPINNILITTTSARYTITFSAEGNITLAVF